MPARTSAAGPVLDADRVSFHVPDPARRLAGVRLWQEVRVPGGLLDFGYDAGGWVLAVDRPAVDRMEYLLELRHADGGTELVTDAANPLRAGGAFGDKSVVEFPGYAAPGWLAASPPPGSLHELRVRSRTLRCEVGVRLWSCAGLGPHEPAPLLVVNDGPEYDELSSLTRFLAQAVEAGAAPPLRAALLPPSPGKRDEWYSAGAAYADALADELVPAVEGAVATTSRVGMGASLGGLAMLHAHRRHPALFEGLFLQSASFFHPRHDAHERRFSHYRRITRFVSEALRADTDPSPVPVVMTCGGIEENVDNNREVAAHLRTLGYLAVLHELRDVHNYTAWRDAFAPHLVDLLREVLR